MTDGTQSPWAGTPLVFFPPKPGEPLIFVLIAARHEGKWIFVRHKDRDTFEMPAGHIEPDETPFEAALRELYEETGTRDCVLELVSPYGVAEEGAPASFGLLYFAEVLELGELPAFEIEERKLFESIPDRLTYPNIQPQLMKKVFSWLEEHLSPDTNPQCKANGLSA